MYVLSLLIILNANVQIKQLRPENNMGKNQ